MSWPHENDPDIMTYIGWMASIGALLLTMALLSGRIRYLPMTTYIIYLLVGLVDGPAVLNLIDIDVLAGAGWLHRLTEFTLIVSLFIGGLKLRVPFDSVASRSAIRMASLAMLLSIGGMAAFAQLLLGFEWPLALILAAMLAPTDPVLASLVSVGGASDHDALRVSLSGEAGLNDGVALPFLLLGLAAMDSGFVWPDTVHWFWLKIMWAIPAGLAIGYTMGWGVGRVSTWLKAAANTNASSDLLALSLILLSYAAAESVNALGFLAVFAAGLGLRAVEMSTVAQTSLPGNESHAEGTTQSAPAETLVDFRESRGEQRDPTMAVGKTVFGALSFGDTLERLLAMLLMLLLGVLLVHYWNMLGLVTAICLFVLVRPLSIWLSTGWLGLPWQRRALMGWFGIRGIGSLCYLTYALTHGLAEQAHANLIVDIVITVVACSVVAHGVSAQPLLAWRRHALRRRQIAHSGTSSDSAKDKPVSAP